MHEMSIAVSLMEQISEAAEAHHVKKINVVEVETGVLRQVIPEVMQEAFQAVTHGTLAEGARLVITQVDAIAVCRQCHRQFQPQIDNFVCPFCRSADSEIIQGDDMVLKSIECMTEGEEI